MRYSFLLRNLYKFISSRSYVYYPEFPQDIKFLTCQKERLDLQLLLISIFLCSGCYSRESHLTLSTALWWKIKKMVDTGATITHCLLENVIQRFMHGTFVCFSSFCCKSEKIYYLLIFFLQPTIRGARVSRDSRFRKRTPTTRHDFVMKAAILMISSHFRLEHGKIYMSIFTALANLSCKALFFELNFEVITEMTWLLHTCDQCFFGWFIWWICWFFPSIAISKLLR